MKILVDVGEVQKRLEELIALARRGDEVVVTKDSQPTWRLRPISDEEAERMMAEGFGQTEEKKASGGEGA